MIRPTGRGQPATVRAQPLPGVRRRLVRANELMADAFDERYNAGVTEELAEPAPEPRARTRAAVAPEQPYALKGCILTPKRKIENGYVTVAGDRIVSVGKAKPDSAVTVLNTDGVITPGLIDLHGHPEFNIFSAW